MVRVCCVKGCFNRSSRNNEISYNRIPEDPKRQNVWYNAINRPDFCNKAPSRSKHSPHTYVCGDHFVTGCKNNNSKHVDYVPTIFTNTQISMRKQSETKRLVENLEMSYIPDDNNESESAMQVMNNALSVLNEKYKCTQIVNFHSKKRLKLDQNSTKEENKSEGIVPKHLSYIVQGDLTKGKIEFDHLSKGKVVGIIPTRNNISFNSQTETNYKESLLMIYPSTLRKLTTTLRNLHSRLQLKKEAESTEFDPTNHYNYLGCMVKMTKEEILHNEHPKCDICNRDFVLCCQFFNHWKRVTDNKKLWPDFCLCEYCGEYFDKKRFESHRDLMHCPQYSYCKICNKKLKTISMNAHQTVHAERTHMCNNCGKMFTTAEYLRTHMLIHSGELPYACRFCDEKFRYYFQRKNHMMKCENYINDVEDETEVINYEELLEQIENEEVIIYEDMSDG